MTLVWGLAECFEFVGAMPYAEVVRFRGAGRPGLGPQSGRVLGRGEVAGSHVWHLRRAEIRWRPR